MKASGSEIIYRIDAILKEKNLKRRAVADAVGISLQPFRDWKKRKSVPPADIFFAIADFLEVSPRYLLTGEPEADSDIPQGVLDMAYEIMELIPSDQKIVKLVLELQKEKYIKQDLGKLSGAD